MELSGSVGVVNEPIILIILDPPVIEEGVNAPPAPAIIAEEQPILAIVVDNPVVAGHSPANLTRAERRRFEFNKLSEEDKVVKLERIRAGRLNKRQKAVAKLKAQGLPRRHCLGVRKENQRLAEAAAQPAANPAIVAPIVVPIAAPIADAIVAPVAILNSAEHGESNARVSVFDRLG